MMYCVTAPVVRDGHPTSAMPFRATFRSSMSIMRIKEEVCRYYGIQLSEMLSDRRAREVSRPRQLAMYLSKQLTQKSYPAIGREFRRDHTTVMYAVRHVEELKCEDYRVVDDLVALRERLAA
jgi:chromosomal replication initiator protein